PANAAAKSRGWPGTPAPCPRGSVPASPAGRGALAVHTPGRRPTVPHRRAGRVRVVEGTAPGRARTAAGPPTPDWRLHAAVGSPTCTDEHAGRPGSVERPPYAPRSSREGSGSKGGRSRFLPRAGSPASRSDATTAPHLGFRRRSGTTTAV